MGVEDMPGESSSKTDDLALGDSVSPRATAHLEVPLLVLFILFASLLLFRGLGALGVATFSSWMACTRYALAVMFLFTSTSHFGKMRHDLARMMPAVFPNPMALVYFTGVCEILGAIGILVARTQSLAGFCLCLFLLSILPANVKAARESLLVAGRPATALWLRIPMQVLFLALISWSTQPWLLFTSVSKP
jgi:uncharacterized membrane protein